MGSNWTNPLSLFFHTPLLVNKMRRSDAHVFQIFESLFIPELLVEPFIEILDVPIHPWATMY
jgi:hypothetical protein